MPPVKYSKVEIVWAECREETAVAEMDREKKSRVLTVPNLLSAFRLLLVPVIVWLYCGEENYPLTACALLLSGATDIADGFIARRFHMVSDLGKVLDPVAAGVAGILLSLVLYTIHNIRWAREPGKREP